MSSAISIESLSMEYGAAGSGHLALDTVSLEIRDNEFFTLLEPLRLRQDHAAAADRRFRAAQRRGDPPLRRADAGPAAVPPPGQHRVPELCAVPAHDGGAEHRLWSRRCRASRDRDRRHGGKDAGAGEAAGRRQPPRRPAVRRPAAAHRPGPRAGQPATGAAARRVAVGAGHEAAQGHADRASSACRPKPASPSSSSPTIRKKR